VVNCSKLSSIEQTTGNHAAPSDENAQYQFSQARGPLFCLNTQDTKHWFDNCLTENQRAFAGKVPTGVGLSEMLSRTRTRTLKPNDNSCLVAARPASP